MDDVIAFKNADRMFTELFYLLRRNELRPQRYQELAFKTEELMVMHQHIENAMDILLLGMQDLGRIVGLVAQNNKILQKDILNIGYLLATIGNLTEALNILRIDTDYVINFK